MARSSYSSRPAGRAVSSRGVAQANGQIVRGRGRGGRPGRPLPACDCCYCVDQRRTAARLPSPPPPAPRTWNNLFWTAAHHANPPLGDDDLVVPGVL